MKKFSDAFRGILNAIKEGGSIYLHFSGMGISIGLGFYFNVSITEWCFLVLAIGLVIAAEIFNSAIENICDFVEPNQHQKIGKIKDMAAGAVLVLAIMAVVVGLLIFLPKIIVLW